MTTSPAPIAPLSTPTSNRLDSAIAPLSYLRYLAYATCAIVFILLAWLAGLMVWQYALLVIISGIIIGYLALSKPILLHISQPPLDKRSDQGWQILMRTAHGDQLWQARLVSARRQTLLVHLHFDVISPYQRPLSLSIFRDQVSDEDWRQLNILALMN